MLQSGTDAITVLEDRLTIVDGGTWSETLTVRVTDRGVTTTQTGAIAGTWLRSGNNLALTNGATNTVTYAGTFSANRLDLGGGGLVFVFTK